MFWLFLSVLLWGSVHSLLASLKAKELFQGWLGRKFMRFYRLAYNAFAGMSFLPVLALVVLTKSRTVYVVPLPWSGLMILGEILAVAGILISFLQTDAWEFLGLRQLEGSARPAQLKTKGLYHFVRHPLYAAGLAVIWLFPIMTCNILVINVALTFYILIRASFEERKLRREFGRGYIDYSAVTPMLVPLIKGKGHR